MRELPYWFEDWPLEKEVPESDPDSFPKSLHCLLSLVWLARASLELSMQVQPVVSELVIQLPEAPGH